MKHDRLPKVGEIVCDASNPEKVGIVTKIFVLNLNCDFVFMDESGTRKSGERQQESYYMTSFSVAGPSGEFMLNAVDAKILSGKQVQIGFKV